MTIFDSLLSENSSINQVLSTKPFDFDRINKQSAGEAASDWLWYAFFLETVLILFGAFWAFFAINIFYKQSLFHRNLVRLSLNINFLWFVMQFSRLVVCIGALWIDPEIQRNLSIFLVKPPFSVAERIRVWAGISAIVSTAAVIYERMVATKRLDFYERISSPFFVGVLVVSSWLIGLVGTFFIFYSPLYATICVFIGLLFIAFVGVGYIQLQRENRRQLRLSMLNSSQYNLSQIFQLKENLRVLVIIKRFILTFMGCFTVLFSIYTIGLFSQNVSSTSNIQLYVVRSFGNLMCNLSGPLMIYSAITGTYVWREMLKQEIRGFFFIGRRTQILPIRKCDLRNLDGKQLTFSINEEQEIYFKQLKLAWA